METWDRAQIISPSWSEIMPLGRECKIICYDQSFEKLSMDDQIIPVKTKFILPPNTHYLVIFHPHDKSFNLVRYQDDSDTIVTTGVDEDDIPVECKMGHHLGPVLRTRRHLQNGQTHVCCSICIPKTTVEKKEPYKYCY